MSRWVIVAGDLDPWGDGIYAFGPKADRTYPSSEVARKDADAIENAYAHVHVVQVVGITDA